MPACPPSHAARDALPDHPAFFHDNHSAVCDASCAEQAWGQTLDFFHKHLG